MRMFVFSHDQQSGSVFVQTVDNARPSLGPDASEAPHVVEQGIDQRSRPVSVRRMHHHTRGFVQDNEIIILINDVQGDVLRFCSLRGRRREGDADVLPRGY